MCGKNPKPQTRPRFSKGSPPRVREKLYACIVPNLFLGITPACAGKTWQCLVYVKRFWDHPRVCGKNGDILARSTTALGSPPRVREKRSRYYRFRHWPGITPACAGKTYLSSALICCSRDHPRVCGKNEDKSLQRETRLGSPPRVREKPAPIPAGAYPVGITPACAGKTLEKSVTASVYQDHPRVCGKNTFDKANMYKEVGSPPRVREKRSHEQNGRIYDGITPACAGKTLKGPNEIKTFLSF